MSWRSGRILASYDYFKNSELNVTDRHYTRTSTAGSLVPKQERHGLLLSGRQSLTDAVWVSGDLVYSARDAESRSATIRNILDNDVLLAMFGVGASLFDDWQLSIDGSFGRNELDREVLSSGQTSGQKSSYENEIVSVDLKADGTLFSIPGGDVRAAFGGSYYRQSFETVQQNPLSNRDLHRDVKAAFAEIYVPIIGKVNANSFAKRLELSFALRTERYSDFGQTTNPKIGLLWSPIDKLIFRTTWGTSFRAPDFFENSVLDSVQLRSNFPDPGSPTGRSTVLILNGGNNPLGPLEPEHGKVLTAGLEFRNPDAPKLRASVNYFRIDYTDRIAPSGLAADILNNPDLFATFITRNPSAALQAELIASSSFFDNRTGITPPPLANVIINSRFINLSSQKVSGIDFSASYTPKIGIGELDFGVDGTYLIKRDDRLVPGGPITTQLNNVYGPIDLVMRFHAGLRTRQLDAVLFVNYRNSYENRFVVPVEPVSSWTTADFTVTYRPDWLPRTEIIASVQNLTDEDPPFVNSPSFDNLNYDAANASALGRIVSFKLRHRW
jgi:hypothetical protein